MEIWHDMRESHQSNQRVTRARRTDARQAQDYVLSNVTLFGCPNLSGMEFSIGGSGADQFNFDARVQLV